MKFLIDAQLPPSLKEVFISKGYYCIHTLDLDLGNNTPDKLINELSIKEKLVLITKDTDFTKFLSSKMSLTNVKLGNTFRKELIYFFEIHFTEIIERIKMENMLLLNRE